MNKLVLNKKIQKYISANLSIDIHALLLKKPVFEVVTNKELAGQILSKAKAKNKLPTWFNTENIYYPSKISVEQTSSELTANYKSNLISGNTLVDLTGGFGVDDYYFSDNFEAVVHCEINEELSEITQHNFRQLGVKNCIFHNGDGLEFLNKSKQKCDWIYLDPSRRNEAKGKVFLMKDCLPNIPDNLDFLLENSLNIMMKTSPLVDISKGLFELDQVKEIHIVAVKNEVKELLWIIEKDFEREVIIKAVNLIGEEKQEFEFLLSRERKEESNYSLPLNYLFEPNSAILKSGGFNEVGIQFGLNKLHQHSHLYSSNELINFPGRIFIIKEVLEYNSKSLKKRFSETKANITTRNFPKKVEEIRKILKIKEGGEVYLFFTTDFEDKKVVIVCEKVTK